jgi:hypothetical protein
VQIVFANDTVITISEFAECNVKAGSKDSSTNASALDSDAHAELRLLKEKFDAAAGVYEELRRASEPRALRWVWTSSRRYHLDPLYFLDPAESAGHVLQSTPGDLRGCAAYGFSEENRIVVERLYVSSAPDTFYKTFYLTSDDRIWSYHFHYDSTPRCINCALLLLAGKSPAHYLRWAVRGWASYRYVALEGRVRSVSAVLKQDDEPEKRYAGQVRYLDDGRVELWTKWDGSQQAKLTFRGKQPAENPFLDSLRT